MKFMKQCPAAGPDPTTSESIHQKVAKGYQNEF